MAFLGHADPFESPSPGLERLSDGINAVDVMHEVSVYRVEEFSFRVQVVILSEAKNLCTLSAAPHGKQLHRSFALLRMTRRRGNRTRRGDWAHPEELPRCLPAPAAPCNPRWQKHKAQSHRDRKCMSPESVTPNSHPRDNRQIDEGAAVNCLLKIRHAISQSELARNCIASIG